MPTIVPMATPVRATPPKNSGWYAAMAATATTNAGAPPPSHGRPPRASGRRGADSQPRRHPTSTRRAPDHEAGPRRPPWGRRRRVRGPVPSRSSPTAWQPTTRPAGVERHRAILLARRCGPPGRRPALAHVDGERRPPAHRHPDVAGVGRRAVAAGAAPPGSQRSGPRLTRPSGPKATVRTTPCGRRRRGAWSRPAAAPRCRCARDLSRRRDLGHRFALDGPALPTPAPWGRPRSWLGRDAGRRYGAGPCPHRPVAGPGCGLLGGLGVGHPSAKVDARFQGRVGAGAAPELVRLRLEHLDLGIAAGTPLSIMAAISPRSWRSASVGAGWRRVAPATPTAVRPIDATTAAPSASRRWTPRPRRASFRRCGQVRRRVVDRFTSASSRR